MQIIDINVESQSRDVATCNAVVLKVNEQFRYLFVPKLIDNSKDNKKCLSGQFIVQKKGKSDIWENCDALPLNKLEKGKWINLDLSTSSMDTLLAYINELKKMYEEEGKYEVFNSVRTFVFLNQMVDEDKELITEMFNKSSGLKEELKKILSSELTLEDIIKLINNKYSTEDFVNKIDDATRNTIYSTIKAKMIKTDYLEQNMSNASEEFWQQLFLNDTNILFSIIPSVSLLIQNKPFVGGKAVDNSGGKNSDFLFRCGLRNTSLIEIKTPKTNLLTKGNRDGIYIPSSDLTSSIVQLRIQKDDLMKEYYTLKQKSAEKDIVFETYDPKCYLIVGNSTDFDFEQIQSFELFRNELKDIEIITYNELIAKLKLIQQALVMEEASGIVEDDIAIENQDPFFDFNDIEL